MIVRCGLAIDCCGREIVVPKDVVTPAHPVDEAAEAAGGTEPDPRYVLRALPRLLRAPDREGAGAVQRRRLQYPAMEYGRIREGYALEWHWVAKDDLEKWRWDAPTGCDPTSD